ncbi:hypothetical protein [Asticcacaulis benevestitus]|uniref:Uncharacterized protein n=1 Tax=Asticcacaulis benevestitus DSM 16100 = ATCC BAA-896 TaxID=1121022 RepID=V4P4H9_9CAUL|nr:hypothetical protein [Asticcacaulis benevestitus]ESQ83001.1 hypothetical protein ABENE_20550 [Asticcacaulis benevestitus DSM 16100 = ATCC BAA-896]
MAKFKKTPASNTPKPDHLNSPATVTPEKQAILTNRRDLLTELTQMALLGHVAADAIIGHLRSNFADELAEDIRQKEVLQQAEEANLRCLDAQFPVPLKAEPEKPLPEPARHYRRLSENRNPKLAHTRR